MMQIESDSKSTKSKSVLDSAEQTFRTTGRGAPLGASVEQGGVNFSVYSRDAARIDLLLFDCADASPSRILSLDPSANRTYHYWHVFVPGLRPGATLRVSCFRDFRPIARAAVRCVQSAVGPVRSRGSRSHRLQPRRCRPRWIRQCHDRHEKRSRRSSHL